MQTTKTNLPDSQPNLLLATLRQNPIGVFLIQHVSKKLVIVNTKRSAGQRLNEEMGQQIWENSTLICQITKCSIIQDKRHKQ
jgi:hypothetical protein